MKRVLTALCISIALFPYAYIIALLLSPAAAAAAAATVDLLAHRGNILMYGVPAYIVFTLICSILLAVINGREQSAARSAKRNMIIKLIHIPAYLFHFILGLAGTLMSVWGIGIVMFAVVIDAVTIILSGIQAAGCAVCAARNGTGKALSVICGIGSFIYCADIIIAVYMYINAKRRGVENAVHPYKGLQDNSERYPRNTP